MLEVNAVSDVIHGWYPYSLKYGNTMLENEYDIL